MEDDSICNTGSALELNAGDVYSPASSTHHDPQGRAGLHTQATPPLSPRPFLVLETPFVANLRSDLLHVHINLGNLQQLKI